MLILRCSEGRVPLVREYKQAVRPVELTVNYHFASALPGGVVNVSPVLYHGTAKIISQQWISGEEIGNPRLSTTSFAPTASIYAAKESGFVGHGFLPFGLGDMKPIDLAKRLGMIDECAKLIGGTGPTQTIILFDRDKLLEDTRQFVISGQMLLRHDERDGILFDSRNFDGLSRSFYLKAMIAALDYDPTSRAAYLKVINEHLWDKNFLTSPPKIDEIQFILCDEGDLELFSIALEYFGIEPRHQRFIYE